MEKVDLFKKGVFKNLKEFSNSRKATSYGNLGTLFRSLGQYSKAQECQEKALAIRIEIGDRDGEATSDGNVGTLFQSLVQYDKAREYQEKYNFKLLIIRLIARCTNCSSLNRLLE